MRKRKLRIGHFVFEVEFRPPAKMEDHFGWFEPVNQRVVIDSDLRGWDLFMWLDHELSHVCWWMSVPRGEESVVTNISDRRTEALRRNRWLRDLMIHCMTGQ